MKYFLPVLLVLFACCSPVNGGDRDLQTYVSAINAKCPKMLDSETRIDGIDLEGDTLTYKYTLINIHVSAVDTQQLRAALWPGILSTIRLNPSMQKIRDDKMTVEYLYRDKDGKIVSLYKVTPQHYR